MTAREAATAWSAEASRQLLRLRFRRLRALFDAAQTVADVHEAWGVVATQLRAQAALALRVDAVQCADQLTHLRRQWQEGGAAQLHLMMAECFSHSAARPQPPGSVTRAVEDAMLQQAEAEELPSPKRRRTERTQDASTTEQAPMVTQQGVVETESVETEPGETEQAEIAPTEVEPTETEQACATPSQELVVSPEPAPVSPCREAPVSPEPAAATSPQPEAQEAPASSAAEMSASLEPASLEPASTSPEPALIPADRVDEDATQTSEPVPEEYPSASEEFPRQDEIMRALERRSQQLERLAQSHQHLADVTQKLMEALVNRQGLEL